MGVDSFRTNMGTRGNFAIRYKSRYYVIYNHWDSYFSGLGYKLIHAIRTLNKEQWEAIKKKLAAISHPVDTPSDSEGEGEREGEEYGGLDINNDNIILRVMSDSNRLEMGRKEPHLDIFIEYVYILDLDVDVFTAISRRHKDEDSIDEEIRYTCRFETLSKEWLDSCESS